MGICAADMKTCDEKKKCWFGSNEGKAYNPADPCCGVGEFDPFTCDCVTDCVRICTVVQFVDGVNDVIDSPNRGQLCSGEFCPDPFYKSTLSPVYGLSPGNIYVSGFYSPASCGIYTRGALVSYTFAANCDGSVHGVQREYATSSFTTDFQPKRADVYLMPWPRPEGCIIPRTGRHSDGAGVIPDCFTLVTSAMNPATGRIACPGS